MLYVEAPPLSGVQLRLKRTFDVVVAALMLVVARRCWESSPLPFASATTVLSCFVNSGSYGGATFSVLKFRTGRRRRVEAGRAADEQQAGPLFRWNDPRVTAGRWL